MLRFMFMAYVVLSCVSKVALRPVFTPELVVEHMHLAAKPSESTNRNLNRRTTNWKGLKKIPKKGGIPLMHSRIESPHTIYIDFDGHRCNSRCIFGAFKATAFSLDESTRVSAVEQQFIYDAWQHIAETFAFLDVDVTTEAPLSFDRQCIHIVITESRQADGQWMPHAKDATGTAYIGGFGSSASINSLLGLVYYDGMAKVRPDYVAEACVHEAGHILGLHHDGKAKREYFEGIFDKSSGLTWAPIMGDSYGADVSQFSDGDYDLSNNREDDIAILGDILGVLEDDVGDTRATAQTPLQATAEYFSTVAVITSKNDVDVFRVPIKRGATKPVVFTATPYSSEFLTGTTLWLSITVEDSQGRPLCNATTTNHERYAECIVSLPLESQEVFVVVKGTGMTGMFSNYASVGQYRLRGKGLFDWQDYINSDTTAVPIVSATSALPTLAGCAIITQNTKASTATMVTGRHIDVTVCREETLWFKFDGVEADTEVSLLGFEGTCDEFTVKAYAFDARFELSVFQSRSKGACSWTVEAAAGYLGQSRWIALHSEGRRESVHTLKIVEGIFDSIAIESSPMPTTASASRSSAQQQQPASTTMIKQADGANTLAPLTPTPAAVKPTVTTVKDTLSPPLSSQEGKASVCTCPPIEHLPKHSKAQTNNIYFTTSCDKYEFRLCASVITLDGSNEHDLDGVTVSLQAREGNKLLEKLPLKVINQGDHLCVNQDISPVLAREGVKLRAKVKSKDSNHQIVVMTDKRRVKKCTTW